MLQFFADSRGLSLGSNRDGVHLNQRPVGDEGLGCGCSGTRCSWQDGLENRNQGRGLMDACTDVGGGAGVGGKTARKRR